MKKTILLTNHYEGHIEKLLLDIIDNRYNLIVLPEVTQKALINAASNADYFLCSGRLQIDETVIKGAKKLKMIQRTGVGLDNIDLEVLKKYNIPLYINRGVNSTSVAEYTLMLILTTLKNNYSINQQIRNGKWERQNTGIGIRELCGKTVGLIGMGNIGKKVAQMLKGFDVNVLYFSDVRLSVDEEKQYGIYFDELDNLLKKSDIISFHCPYNKKYGYMLSSEEIDKMKDGAIIINTARGRLIDEAALIDALKCGKISACGIDTFENEPINSDDELLNMPQVILSPHVAGLSYESYERMFERAIDNIVHFDNEEFEMLKCNLYK